MSERDGEDQLDPDLRAVIEEMIAAWDGAPTPGPRAMESSDRADSAEVGADVVIWAWTNRVVRTARAALLLHDDGFGIEASPLRRTLLEHAVAIHWLADKRGPAYQALVRARSLSMQKFNSAQAAGWELTEDQQRLLEDAIAIGTDDETRSEDTFVHAKQRAEAYGFGAIHQGWLIETWTSHPSLMSALPYYEHLDESADTELYPFPKPMARETLLIVGVALHIALTGYERLVPDAFSELLPTWKSRLDAAAMAMARRVSDAGGPPSAGTRPS